MIIGIDLRVLQTGHKYRGIGEVGKQITSRILKMASNEQQEIKFVFFQYDLNSKKSNDPLELIEIPDKISYELKNVGPDPENDDRPAWPKFKRALRELYGNPVPGASKCDVYIQFDWALGVPRWTKTILWSYDFIPLVFKRQYFISAWEPFKNRAARSTIRTLYHNYKYKRVTNRTYRRAKKIIAISENTKKDILKYTPAKKKHIEVICLGVDEKHTKTTSLSSSNSPEALITKPYLAFIAAGDTRRRVEDLVHAFNNLKAEGHDIQLALVGENFMSQETIPNPHLRKVVQNSSYKEDILTLGYVNDELKEKLYKNAIAYVYPTLYEGFGLPVLEAMLNRSPVITYNNSSLYEVGGNHAFYADGWWGIKVQVENILTMSEAQKEEYLTRAYNHAKKFTWDSCTEKVYRMLSK